jgi:hypothetical protein
VTDALLYKATIFVEGEDDVAFLREGFGELLKRYQLKAMGGRAEIEKTVREIQDLERSGRKVDPIFMVFDRDRKPTASENTRSVRILQWRRYSLENYLIDVEAIAELLKQPDICRTPYSSQGAVENSLREIALVQLDEVVAREVYAQFGYESPGLRSEDVLGKSLEQIASTALKRLTDTRESIDRFPLEGWKTRFLQLCSEKRESLKPIWEARRKEECDGKRFFQDFAKSGVLRLALSVFRRRVLRQMKAAGSENWRLMDSQLRELLEI